MSIKVERGQGKWGQMGTDSTEYGYGTKWFITRQMKGGKRTTHTAHEAWIDGFINWTRKEKER